MWEKLISAVMAIAALAVASVYVTKELRRPANSMSFGEPQYVMGWEEELDAGVRRGASDAPTKLLQFVDFECPFCRRHARFVAELRREYGEQLEIITFHLPLTGLHRFAQISAVAAECAGLQNRFQEMAAALYANQDSIGLKSWSSLAEGASVPNPDQVAQCVEENRTMPRIEAGSELAARMGAHATPTVLINGWRFPSAANLRQMREAIDAVLRGEEPMEGDSVSMRRSEVPRRSSLGEREGPRQGAGRGEDVDPGSSGHPSFPDQLPI